MPTFIGVPALPHIPRATLPVSPAPPHMPQVAPIPQAPRSPPPPPPGIQKHATLIGLENPMLPAIDPPPPPSISAPIIAPGTSANPPGAVTQPPPWEGSAEIHMPKIPESRVPKLQPVPQSAEELSGSILLEDSQAGPLPRPRDVELSSSDLVERESSVSVVKAAPLGVGSKASTLLGMSPSPPPVQQRAEPSAPPPRVASAPPPRTPTPRPPEAEPTQKTQPKSFDLRVLRTGAEKQVREILEGPRPRLYLFAGAAALVVIIFFGTIIRLISGGSSDDTTPVASASVSASVSAPPVTSHAPVPIVPPPVATTALASCSVAGDAHVVSPHALIQAGVEVVTLGDAVALGFASGPKEAMVATLDPATIAATATNKVAAANPVRRVTPNSSADKAAIDADAKTDAIRGRRAVAGWDIGAADGNLVWATRGSATGTKLWALDADAAAEAIRGVATSDGLAVAYRHNGAIFLGAAKGDKLDAYGAPNKIAGLGPQVGSPTIAYGEGNVLVAWADRAATSDPWGIRIVAWHPGDAAKPAKSFALPPGGLGEHAMAPGLSALSGGKFLLVWTEGPVSSHQVRAQVLDADGSPSGNAMTVSAEGVNAGQGQAAVLSDGRGVAAFLAGSGKNFEVRATPIRCK
jgi:hypothetical protein